MARGQRKVGEAKDETLAKIPQACVDEIAAVRLVEDLRWGKEPACPRCGSTDVYQMLKRGSRERRDDFRWRCRDCKRMYSVRTETIFAESPIPMRIWCHLFWRACSSKKGVSALQISRETGLSYKSALFAMHRVRHAMAVAKEEPQKLSGIVEADETYVGGRPRHRGHRNPETGKLRTGRGTAKTPVFAIVQRGGDVRLSKLDRITAPTLLPAIWEAVDLEKTTIVTDELGVYHGVGRRVSGGHHTIKHGDRQYVDGWVHSNTVESVFSLIKRGLMGTFHSVSKHHLHRYLSEFEYRWNTRDLPDGERTAQAIRQAEGKRLRYHEPNVA